MKIIFAILDKIASWSMKYLSRAWLFYDILFSDYLFVRVFLLLLFCLDVYTKLIDYELSLKADVSIAMSHLIIIVCFALYMIPIFLPISF